MVMVKGKQETKAMGAFSLAFVSVEKLVPINALCTLTVLHQYNIVKARPTDALHRTSSSSSSRVGTYIHVQKVCLIPCT